MSLRRRFQIFLLILLQSICSYLPIGELAFAGSINEAPKNLKLRSLSGNRTESVLSSEKYTLVQFWASWCVDCKAIVKELKEFSEKNPRLKFVTVSIDQSLDEALLFFDKVPRSARRVKESSFLDPEGQKFASKIGVESVPQVVLIDVNGKVVKRISSHPTPKDKKEIQRLLTKN